MSSAGAAMSASTQATVLPVGGRGRSAKDDATIRGTASFMSSEG